MTAPNTPVPSLVEPLCPLRLTCFEYRGRIGSGMTDSHYATARTTEGRSVEVILKLREPGPPISQGHYGGTSLACELIFAVFARALGLNVPDYGIVQIGSIFANGVRDDNVRNLLVRNLGPNFASVRLRPSPGKWNPSHPTPNAELRAALEAVLCFDAAVLNGDRKARNPNLLWDGRDTVHVIDHGLACPIYLSPAHLPGNPLFPDPEICAHSAFNYLHGNSRRYEALLNGWATVANTHFWRALEGVIPPQWERQAGDLRSIFDFLVGRNPRFPDISAQLRRLVQ